MLFKPIALEEAIFQRIMRGQGRDSDFECEFKLLTNKMSQAEKEIFFQKIDRRRKEKQDG